MNDKKVIYDAIHKNKLNGKIVTEIDKDSTDEQIPTAKATNDRITTLANEVGVDLDKYGEYFTIEATQDSTTIYFRQSPFAVSDGLDPLKVEVSTDNGTTWIEVAASVQDNGAVVAALNAGDKILIRGNNSAYGYYSDNEGTPIENCNFWSSKSCYVYGNIMSLVSSSDFSRLFKVEPYAFAYFFSDYDGELNWSWVLNKDNSPLLLPATTLADGCYQSMFDRCVSLTASPALPATTLAEWCYRCMFYGCAYLTSAPSLPATILAEGCYSSMFQNCTMLATAPELPATTLANACYQYMFRFCTHLTTAPVLPATTLSASCYKYMFDNCTNLSYIKALFTTTPSDSYTESWVSGVNSTGTFVKSSDATWTVIGENGVPNGWGVNRNDPTQTEEQADWDEKESSRANYIWHKPEYSLVLTGETLYDVTGYNIPFQELCRFNKQPKMSFYDLYFLKTDENQPLINYLFGNLGHDFEDGYELMAAFGSFNIGVDNECTGFEMYGAFRKIDDDTEILVYALY